MKKRYLVGIVAAIIAMTTMSIPAAQAAPWRTPGTGPEVLIIGDSNIYLGGPNLVSVLHPYYSLTLDGVAGITATNPYWVTAIPAEIAATHPAAVIIQLGTNDAGQKLTMATWQQAVLKIMTLIPSNVKVQWNTIRNFPGGAKAVKLRNDYLYAVQNWVMGGVRVFPNLTVIDEATYFKGHPKWVDSSKVHYTLAGYTALGQWFLANLRAQHI